jgi:autotransporter-associated beta strand protein
MPAFDPRLTRAFLCALASPFAILTAPAALLQWGANGAGGTGTWNTSLENWWNGSQNVTWTSGNDAIFGGEAGTVTALSVPGVSSITFDTAGYTLSSSIIHGFQSGLVVTTNADATIRSMISTDFLNPFTKQGAATLTLASPFIFSQNLIITEGELRLIDDSPSSFQDITVAATGNATLTFAGNSQAYVLGSLSGGGIVRPGAVDSTKEISILSGGIWGGTWGGTIQDNGPGKLAIRTGGGLTFTNSNTYSGTTTLTGGIFTPFKLSAAGALPNSSVVISGGKLVLDNSGTALSNRFSDSQPLRLQGGEIEIVGNAATPVLEDAGTLILDRAYSLIRVTGKGSTVDMRFNGLSRAGKGTLNIDGTGVILTGVANQPSGILSPSITMLSEWAATDSTGRVVAYSAYSNDINTGSALDNVKLTGAGVTHLSSSTERATLNFQNNTSQEHLLDLGSNSLNLGDGGILMSGTAAKISNGQITAPNELIITTHTGTLEISANITESSTPLALTKTGETELILSGNNTYSGITTINAGVLSVSSDSNLGTGSAIDMFGGVLRANATFSSTKILSGTRATIDTSDYNVAFAQSTAETLTKYGAGKLTITAPSDAHFINEQGTLSLPNAQSATVELHAGALDATGKLSTLRVDTWTGLPTHIDIGDTQVATLEVEEFYMDILDNINFVFDISANTSDLLSFEFQGLASTTPISFSFRNLGGISTGLDYQLMLSEEAFNPYLQLAFSPEALAAGWSGQFNISEHSISVRFDTVAAPIPEPGTIALLTTAAATLLLRKRRQA